MASIHVVVLVVVMILPGCRRWWQQRQAPPQIFEVDVSVLDAEDEPISSVPDVAAAPEPEPELEPELEPDPEPKPEPKPEPPKPDPPKRREIVKGPRVVRKTGSDQPKLSPEEVRRLLEEGAKAGTQTLIPGEEQRCFSMIRHALHTSWEQPPRDAVGNAVAQVTLQLGSGGRISGARITRSSGIAEMDASVASVLSRVTSVPGLTKAFIESHPEVTVDFKLD